MINSVQNYKSNKSIQIVHKHHAPHCSMWGAIVGQPIPAAMFVPMATAMTMYRTAKKEERSSGALTGRHRRTSPLHQHYHQQQQPFVRPSVSVWHKSTSKRRCSGSILTLCAVLRQDIVQHILRYYLLYRRLASPKVACSVLGLQLLWWYRTNDMKDK